MAKRRLFWKIFPSLLAIVVIAVAIMVIYTEQTLKQSYREQTHQDLLDKAYLVEHLVTPMVLEQQYPEVDSLCKEIFEQTGVRVTLILSSGVVVADSRENPAIMENHALRPEVVESKENQIGVKERFSSTLQLRMMYLAMNVETAPEPYVVRVAYPMTAIEKALGGLRFRIILGGLVVAILATVVSLILTRRISRPLESLKRGAERFARGAFKRKLSVKGSDEISTLAAAMNYMADEISTKITTITEHRQTQEAIMASMVEGVVAVDVDERIISINRAAADFFDINVHEYEGRYLHEVVRSSAMQLLVQQILLGGESESVQAELSTGVDKTRYLQASGSILRDNEGHGLGAVVVLNDVTRIQELEDLRRDFVANVSHELRTPITLIKGYVETLQDGSVDDAADVNRFLGIIARHSDQLNQLIEDLLSLSRIEQGPAIKFEEGPLEFDLTLAISECEPKAREKNIVVKQQGVVDVNIEANHHLVGRAVSNLIDNAIKYSDPGSEIVVRTEMEDHAVKISVTDHGCGIEEQHLARLFERFYRVDKARSRELGGTGLGLAIVKHIANAHGGSIDVESTPGEGSTFSLTLPLS